MVAEQISAAAGLAGLDASLARLVKVAERRAERLHRPVLASASVILDGDVRPQQLLWLSRGMTEWSSLAGESMNLVCWGAAAHIQDDADLATVSAAWKELVTDSVRDWLTSQSVGPVIVFGHSFAEDCDTEGPWKAFGRSRAIVPHVSIREYNGSLLATASVVVGQDGALPVGGRSPGFRTGTGSKAAFVEAVEAAVLRLRRGDAEKVVLTRSVHLETGPVEPMSLLGRLDSMYPETCRYAISVAGATLVGATPELLCSVRGHSVRTMALAGSVPTNVGASAALSDPKLLREHAIVAEYIEKTLGPRSETIHVNPEPRVVSLRNIRHLRTDIRAELGAPASVLEVAQWLHPTPAIGGYPVDRARSLIKELEHHDRGWYTGPFGWIDAAGDGDCWVALRCALLTDTGAELFAGAGIVRDSDALLEFAETDWKLTAMRDALALPARSK
ncbi:isochorismate synthase [Kribbella sp. CA-253562]|uniref:isochorismate synthase n=1 Tax=Kribbella sp. CA-253562 TaxID=3239942 RepID=UPI003D8C7125